ncbi:DinB family protein [Streptomyces sp. NBC_01178]|uniref:DinB family protein n=1 Tax=Streptomyces sp. NBC_01178 TaxID=2903762 RepID=UPI003870CB15|nr:DinB family protein [Streptomyces sp. NBC_01178]
MTTTPPAATPAPGTERSDLLAALAAARAALVRSVEGIDDGQAGETPTASALCLGGLIKHVTAVEENWLNFITEGPSAMDYTLPEGVTWDDLMAGTARAFPQWAIDREKEFRMQPGETAAGLLQAYEETAARTEKAVLAVPDLSAAHPLPEAPWHEPGGEWSVRRVLAHVITETAQHAGHADILRETLDGRRAT